MKVLIIGANGFLGSNLIQKANLKEFSHFSLVGGDISNSVVDPSVPFYNIDITKRVDVINKVEKISPDVIILTAAMTDVDNNEVQKEQAIKINTEGAVNVLNACKVTGSKLLFMSTDFIFDGTKGNYTEEDKPNPLSHYGQTKHAAELAIITSDAEYLICRTAVLYGWNPNKLNFITWMLNKLENNERINIVTDQVNSPTYVPNLAEILLKLIEKNANGIYHTAGDDSLNRYEMALKCAEIFEFDQDLIFPIDHLDQQAVRPKNAGLNITKLKKFLGSEVHVYNLEEGLREMKRC
jgi:dTDP-4-dehydrorhamnose reductase